MLMEQAQRVAAFINAHDGGTPMPRAFVVWNRPTDGYVVRFSTSEYNRDTDSSRTVWETAESLQNARNLLGY